MILLMLLQGFSENGFCKSDPNNFKCAQQTNMKRISLCDIEEN